MTSNIGQYDITRMLREGCSQEEIEDVVMKQFTQERHYKTHEPCFRPEFIGRASCAGAASSCSTRSPTRRCRASRGSCSARSPKSFRGGARQCRLVCDDQVIDMIAKTVFDENEEVIRARGNGYFGGRRLDIMMDQHIRNKLARQLRQLSGAPVVRVVLDGGETAIVPVFSDGDAQALLKERRLALLSRVSGRFGRLLDLPDNAFDALDEGALSRLDALMAEIGGLREGGKGDEPERARRADRRRVPPDSPVGRRQLRHGVPRAGDDGRRLHPRGGDQAVRPGGDQARPRGGACCRTARYPPKILASSAHDRAKGATSRKSTPSGTS